MVSELTSPDAGPAPGAISPADACLPFIVGGGAFRGRLVRLTTTAQDILGRRNEPEPVSVLLAEALAAAVALAAGLKYKGVFTLQIQGNGPVSMLVADVTSEGDLRGCTKFEPDEVAAVMARPRQDGIVPYLLGMGGHLAFTVDQGPDTERYQGIVELTGGSLAEAVHHYFRQSEQLESALKVAVAPPEAEGEGWIATALLLQRMPEEGGLRPPEREEADDAWRTAVILLGSLKDAELLDLNLPPEQVLKRLFWTIGVQTSARKPVRFKCRCSQERSERIVASFPVEEVRSFAEDGMTHITCEFCRTDYVFPADTLEDIARKHRPETETETETEKGDLP